MWAISYRKCWQPMVPSLYTGDIFKKKEKKLKKTTTWNYILSLGKRIGNVLMNVHNLITQKTLIATCCMYQDRYPLGWILHKTEGGRVTWSQTVSSNVKLLERKIQRYSNSGNKLQIQRLGGEIWRLKTSWKSLTWSWKAFTHTRSRLLEEVFPCQKK